MRRSWVEDYTAVQTGLTMPLTREALEAWQLAQLEQLLTYVREHSRFYRDYPKTLTSLAELEQLPLIEDSMLAKDGQAMVCLSQSAVQRVVTLQTSGTTGQAKRLYYSAEDIKRTVDFFAYGLREIAAPGAKVVVMMPSQRPDGVGQLILRGSAQLGAEGIAAPLEGDFASLAALVASQADAVVGLPGHLLSLGRYLRTQGRNSLKQTILTSADGLTPPVEQALHRLWGDVVDHYGSTESGLGGAVQCSARGGRHIRESDLLCEIIDPLTGQRLPDGQWGELVLTTLTREAMPLLRYRTGDLTRILPGECPCGSLLKRLDRIQRRKADPKQQTLAEKLWLLEDVVDFDLHLTAKGWQAQVLCTTAEAVRPLSEALADLAVLARVRPVSGQDRPFYAGKRPSW